MRTRMSQPVVVLLASSALLGWPGRPAAVQIDEKQAYEIGLEAYVFVYPLISMDVLS